MKFNFLNCACSMAIIYHDRSTSAGREMLNWNRNYMIYQLPTACCSRESFMCMMYEAILWGQRVMYNQLCYLRYCGQHTRADSPPPPPPPPPPLFFWIMKKYAYLVCEKQLKLLNPRSWDHSGYEFSHWETSLHCNDVSRWLSPYPEWSLRSTAIFLDILVQRRVIIKLWLKWLRVDNIKHA